jgi:hypothetical protein
MPTCQSARPPGRPTAWQVTVPPAAAVAPLDATTFLPSFLPSFQAAGGGDHIRTELTHCATK